MDDYFSHLRKLEALEKRRRRKAILIPLVLMLLTTITTLFAGAMMQFLKPSDIWRNPEKILAGATFAAPLMLILFTHEMGHFLTSKAHRVKASLPYFIPFPNFIGTFGAVIRMKSPMRDRRALMDIGAAGPIAGFVLSLIACAWGITHLEAIPIDYIPEESFWNPRIRFGDNLAIIGLYHILDIKRSPAFIYVNPVYYAGWLGMFVTSLNLLPAGQLDGGHIAYAMFGEQGAKWLARIVVVLLILLGLPVIVNPKLYWVGWLMWGALILLLGLKHPPPLHPETELDNKRKIIGLISVVIFLLTFSPMPLQMY